jgi:hypothetical protein
MGLRRRPPDGNVRRVQTNGHNLRYTITNKAGHLVQCESHQERKLALLLDRDNQVTDYRSQPETLHWYDAQGKDHTYVPDFQVWRADGTIELHEVTLTRRLETGAPRQAAAMAICATRGWQYVIHTENTLPDECEWQNLLAVYPYRASSYREAHWVRYLFNTLHKEALSWSTLQTACLPQNLPALHSTTLHLLWHGQLTTDWTSQMFADGHLRPQVWLESEVRHAQLAP